MIVYLGYCSAFCGESYCPYASKQFHLVVGFFVVAQAIYVFFSLSQVFTNQPGCLRQDSSRFIPYSYFSIREPLLSTSAPLSSVLCKHCVWYCALRVRGTERRTGGGGGGGLLLHDRSHVRHHARTSTTIFFSMQSTDYTK